MNRVPPNPEIFEERAAIIEYDGGLTRADAEQLAAECQGYENVVAFRAAQLRRIPRRIVGHIQQRPDIWN